MNRKTITTRLLQTLTLAALALALHTPAQAATWVDVYGTWMSNTCVSGDGTYMNFYDQAGPVGSPCSFYFDGMPGVHFGEFR